MIVEDISFRTIRFKEYFSNNGVQEANFIGLC